MKLKNRKITVLLEEAEFQRFEDYCSQKGHKKSTLISKLISDYLDKETKVSENRRNEQ